MISFIALLLSSAACVCLQCVSRNLLFAIVGIMGLGTTFLVECMKSHRVKWPFALISVLGNGLLLVNTVAHHLVSGYVVNDYLICTAVLLLFILITLVEIPTKASA